MALLTQWPAPGDPDHAGAGDLGVATQHDDQRPREEVGGEDVEERRQTQEEGEAFDRPGAEHPQDQGGGEGHGVGRQHGAEGTLEAFVHTGPHRSPASHLIL